MAVYEINDPAGLDSLRGAWDALLVHTPGASFFHSLDWLDTYRQHFGASGRLRVLVVEDGGQITGIVPLVLRARRRFGRVRVLGYPLDDWGSFYGPIGPNPSNTLIAAAAYLRQAPRDWDLVELAWVDGGGDQDRQAAASLARAGMPTAIEHYRDSAIVNLAGYSDWNAYWASRTSRWRNNVRRSEKKLRERGRIKHVRYRPRGAAASDADPRWDLYEACQRIASASWQSDSKTGTTLTHESIRPFLEDCHAAAARAGALDLNLLLIDDVPVAFNYAYCYRGNVFGLRTGFDRQIASDGAGTVLQRRMIESSFARGDHEYNLGADYLACKRYWQTETRASYRLTHFAAGAPMAQLARFKRSLKIWFGKRNAKSAAIPG